MVRRKPLDFNPTDMRKGNILQDLAYKGLRKLGGLKSMTEMAQEITPSLDNSSQDAGGIERAAPIQNYGDARKLNPDTGSFNFNDIYRGLVKIFSPNESKNPIDAALPTPADSIQQAENQALSGGLNASPQEKDYRGYYMHAGMTEDEKEKARQANAVEPKKLTNSATPQEKDYRGYYMHAGMTEGEKEKARQANRGEPNASKTKDELTPQRAQEILDTMRPELLDRMPEYRDRLKSIANVQGKNESFNQKIEEAQQNPLSQPVNGAADNILSDPEKTAEFSQITGFDPEKSTELLEAVKAYEQALDPSIKQYGEAITALDEEAARIKERLDNGQLTNQDKIMIGVALILPAIISGVFGGFQGAASALGAGGAALTKGLSSMSEDEREQGKTLADLAVKKAALAKGKSELETSPAKFKKDFAENLRKLSETGLEGTSTVKWSDPSTGETKEGIRVLPGFVADPDFISDKEDLKEMKKVARDINSTRLAVNSINELSEDVIELASKVDDEDRDFIAKMAENIILGNKPDLKPLMGKTVDFKGTKVNLAVALEDKLALLVDAYRQAQGMRALTGTVADHIGKVLNNPIGTFQTFNDLNNQMLYLRDLSQKRLNKEVENAGFYPEWIGKESNESNRKVSSVLTNKENLKQAYKDVGV